MMMMMMMIKSMIGLIHSGDAEGKETRMRFLGIEPHVSTEKVTKEELKEKLKKRSVHFLFLVSRGTRLLLPSISNQIRGTY